MLFRKQAIIGQFIQEFAYFHLQASCFLRPGHGLVAASLLGGLSASHGRAILGLSEEAQVKLAEEIVEKGLSVKETEERAAKLANPKPAVKKKAVVRYGRDMQLQINTIKQAVKLAKESGVKVKVTEAKSPDEYQITIVMKNQRKKKED